MIERELANVFDLTITRPRRLGPGGDITATDSVAANLCAIYEQTNELIRDVDGSEITVRGRFYVDPCDNDGVTLDIRTRDHLQWSDYRGTLVKTQQVRRVTAWFIGAEVDHILLEVG